VLKGIDPRLTPDALHALALLGHGDSLVIVDANFPAASVAVDTVYKKPVNLTLGAVDALEAVLSLVPIDTYDLEQSPVRGMQVVGEPDTVPEVVQDASPMIEAEGQRIELIERHAFYAAARECFVVIHTAERRPYGNFIVRAGVV